MDAHLLNTIANFIWGIADDCLRDVYVRGKYYGVPDPIRQRALEYLDDRLLAIFEALENLH